MIIEITDEEREFWRIELKSKLKELVENENPEFLFYKNMLEKLK